MVMEQDFHFETLRLEQQKLWPQLKPAAALDYTLYGGTAIALRLGHRQSEDFDFFSSIPQDEKKILVAMSFLKTAKKIQDEPDAKSFLISVDNKDVKISFFNDLDMGRVGTPSFTPDGVVRMASPEDLLVTKIKVILNRVALKDYQDLAAMCRAGYNLETGLAGAKVMFAPNFSPVIGVKALNYFEDGELHKLAKQDKEILVKSVNALNLKNLPEIALLSKDLTDKNDKAQGKEGGEKNDK